MRADQIAFKFEPLVRHPLVVQDPRTFQPLGSAKDITLSVPRFTGFSPMGDESRRHDAFANVKQISLSGVPYPLQPLRSGGREFGSLVKRLPFRPFMTAPSGILRVVPHYRTHRGNSLSMVM